MESSSLKFGSTSNKSSKHLFDGRLRYQPPLHVTAGIGPFNASLVQPFVTFLQSLGPPDLGLTVLPNSYAAMVGMLAMNPLITTTSSSVACNDTRCTSYLMTGGLEPVTPWIPEGYREYSLATIRRMPSIQLDIIPSNDYVFQKEDSDVFGEDGMALGIKL
jgi:hypothetical protein